MELDYTYEARTITDQDIATAKVLIERLFIADTAGQHVIVKHYARILDALLMPTVYLTTAESTLPRQLDRDAITSALDALYSIEQAAAKFPTLTTILEVARTAELNKLRKAISNAYTHTAPTILESES